MSNRRIFTSEGMIEIPGGIEFETDLADKLRKLSAYPNTFLTREQVLYLNWLLKKEREEVDAHQ